MKLIIIGAGEIGKSTLDAIFRIFPKDKDLEIILLNRTKERANAAYLDASLDQDENDFSNKLIKVRSSKIKFKIGSNDEDLKDSDIIIFTAGVSAVSLGSSSREFALPFVYNLTRDYAKLIKQFAPESSILIITNPVDITTMIMQDATGFPPERVLGFGCELDSRRFIRSLKQELEKIAIITTTISADVIGGHSPENMIVPRNSLIINGLSLPNFKAKYSNQSEEIELAIKNSDMMMRKEGFEIIKNHGKAYIAPVIPLVIAARSLLFGGDSFMTCSQVLTKERGYYAITDSLVSVPLIIGKKKVIIDQEKYLLSDVELINLRAVAKKHQTLFYDIKSMPNKFMEAIQEGLKKMEAELAQIAVERKFYSDEFRKNAVDAVETKKKLENFNKIERNIQKNIFEVEQNSQIGYSNLKVKLSAKCCELFTDQETRSALLQNMADHFLEKKVECKMDKESMIVANNQETIKILKDIGLLDKAKIQSRL